MLRIWSWNIQRRREAWRTLEDDGSVDIALLQEAIPPPPGMGLAVTPTVDERWTTVGSQFDYRTAIAWRPYRVEARTVALGTLEDDSQYVIPVSRPGTLTALEVRLADGPLTLISAYAYWETPRTSRTRPEIYSDASAHRLVSDISALIGSPEDHRILVAGDFNILHGFGDHGSAYWKTRYDLVFARFEAIGLAFLGPQAPDGGRQADPWPDELPRDSRNVPTAHSSTQTPATASRQLDYVFASQSVADRIHVRARNAASDWGPSDHCRVEILVEGD